MGCWNGTCMLSGLPIHSGDPVAGFLLVINSSGDSQASCYSTTRAAPLTTPIYGAYNDYGAIEDFEPHSELLAMSCLPLKSMKAIGEDLQEGEESETIDFKSLEAICSDGAERGTLAINHSYHGERPVGLVLIHRFIFDAVIAKMAQETGWQDKNKNFETLFREELLTLKNQATIDLKEQAKIEKIKDAEEREAQLAIFKLKKDMKSFRGESFFRSGSDGDLGSGSLLMKNSFVLDAIQNEKSMEELIKMKLFGYALSTARQEWRLTSGAGSQNDDVSIQHVIAKATVEHCEAKIEEKRLLDLEYEDYERKQGLKI